jgi:hypothetical protein
MSEEKKEDPNKKLENEFRDFQKEWKKFLTNDFQHLVTNVGIINTHVDTLIKQNVKEHSEIQQGMELMQGNMESMNQQLKAELDISKRIVGILDKKI